MVHRIRDITNYIYVDESKQRDYLLVASVHVDSDLAELRAVVRNLLLPGQRYLHMKNEKAGRKRTIAQAFVTAGVTATVYRAGSPLLRTEKGRRTACLGALIADHATAHATHIVFDQDDTLLGIPDAIAWCWAKGGPWRQLVAPAVTDVRDV